jgi:hypothetical protein
VPLRVGETCSLTVNLPNEESIVVAAAIVRWVQGQEYGMQTSVVEKQMQSRLEHLVKRLVRESVVDIPSATTAPNGPPLTTTSPGPL